jgi:hypothetical protein
VPDSALPTSNRYLTAFSILLLLVAPLAAQETEPPSPADPVEEQDFPPEPSKKRVQFRFSLETLYDENLINLRDDAIDEFESGDYEPDRYRIESVDDVLLVPGIWLEYSVTPETGRSSGVGAFGSWSRPLDNAISNYERYGVFFSQDITDIQADLAEINIDKESLQPKPFKTRRSFLLSNRSDLQLMYYHTDSRYSGQLSDDDFGVRREARYDYDTYSLDWRQRLSRGDVTRPRLLLGYRYIERDYNQFFNERDSTADVYRLGLDLFRLHQSFYSQIEGLYEFQDLESNTALIGTVGPGGTVEDDLTHTRDRYRLRLAFYWYAERDGAVLRKSNRLRFGLTYAAKDYTTDNVLDLTHFKRKDDIYQFTAEYRHALLDNLTLEVYGRLHDQDTSRPILDELEETSFNDFVVGLKFNFYASWSNG